MIKKHIKYYGVEISLRLYSYDNDPALTCPILFLNNKKKKKKFKTREEAEKFFNGKILIK